MLQADKPQQVSIKPMLHLDNDPVEHEDSRDSGSQESEHGSQSPQVNHIIKLSYLVSPEEGVGSFTKIQKAIDQAKPDSVIKIAQGLYAENLVIRNKSLKLEAKDMNSEVYILGENGPALTIENNGGELVTVERIKFAHKGGFPARAARGEKKGVDKTNMSVAQSDLGQQSGGAGDISPASPKKQTRKTVINLQVPSNADSNPSAGMDSSNLNGPNSLSIIGSKAGTEIKQTHESYLNDVLWGLHTIDEKTNCVILVKSGNLTVRNSKINLNLITKLKTELSPFVPAIIALNNSTVIVSFSELRGSNTWETVGLLMRQSNLVMKDCLVTHFLRGGISLLMAEQNSLKIINSKITFNKGFGIQVMGRTDIGLEFIKDRLQAKETVIYKESDEYEIIRGCDIEKNDGPGIQVCIPNTCLIKQNKISFNTNGIEVISADPRIVDNTITKNRHNGIFVKALSSMPASPVIKANCIRSNKENGIYCTGFGNTARISLNTEIMFNKLCGIKIEEQARPIILSNIISKNIFQGVLIVENASAHLEKNEISENIKANIALGGDSSADTVIKRNTITKGRCEGIFMIEAGSAYIQENTITDNYDGIIMITSSPEVSSNYISENKNSGVIIMKDSRPKVYNNQLFKNGNVGFFVRDNSRFDRPLPEEPEDEQPELLKDLDMLPAPKLEKKNSVTPVMQMRRTESNQALLENGFSKTKSLRRMGVKRLLFSFYDNRVADSPVGLVVERMVSNGKEIVQMNDFNELECRVPYTCREMKCNLI